MLLLEIQPRDARISSEILRKGGAIPAVFYGPKEASTPISIESRRLESVWRDAGETTIITLTGVGEQKDTLIRDVQVHPVTGTVMHVDFYVLEKGKKLQISVPLEFVGAAPAEKLGHVLVKALHEIEIEVAPAELPHSLEVDITKLENVGDNITAAQIVLPPSATLITDPEETVASVTEFKEEKAEDAAPQAEGAESTPAPEPAEESSGD